MNNLTDIQDPSVESNSVNIYHKQSEIINDLLNEDEDDLSYTSDKKQGYDDTSDKDVPQALAPPVNKKPNSVDR